MQTRYFTRASIRLIYLSFGTAGTINNNNNHSALDITVKSEVMKKVFRSINLDIEEVAEFIENNGLSFMCNEDMNVEASEEDFDKLIEQFPELDYVEL